MAENRAKEEIAKALAAAHEAMRMDKAAILMIARHNDSNLYDQQVSPHTSPSSDSSVAQWLVLTLAEKYGIEVIRRQLNEIMDCSILDDSGNLVVDGRVTSVVYYRSGYAPSFYPTAVEWESRKRIELSSACKCPSIRYHLTGTKKVQQELAKPGRLERYLSDEECNRVREFFAGLWGLDDLTDPDIQAIVKQAQHDPSGFVLKPQREGGGNNLYGKPFEPQIHTLS